MNCDQVFDILTRGPFPSGATSDAAVQRHLSGCGECRQLAEALRPALDLIHEAVPPEESWGLPGYWEDVPPGERPAEPPVTVKQRPQLAVRRMRLPNEARGRRSAASERWRLAALAAVAGALAAIAVLGVERVGGQRPSGAGSGSATALLTPIAWPPEKCAHEPVAAKAPSGQLATELQSCRGCHREREHWNVRSATLEVAAACLACHEFVAHN